MSLVIDLAKELTYISRLFADSGSQLTDLAATTHCTAIAAAQRQEQQLAALSDHRDSSAGALSRSSSATATTIATGAEGEGADLGWHCSGGERQGGVGAEQQHLEMDYKIKYINIL